MTTRTWREVIDDAAEVNAQVNLFDVRLVSAAGEAPTTEYVGRPMGVLTEVETDSALEEADVLTIRARYAISAHELKNEGKVGPSPEDPVAWRIEAVFAASFHRTPEGPDLTPTQLASFARTTAFMAIHPYAREFAQSLSGRFGYPPFTLELIRVPRPGDPGLDSELVDLGELAESST